MRNAVPTLDDELQAASGLNMLSGSPTDNSPAIYCTFCDKSIKAANFVSHINTSFHKRNGDNGLAFFRDNISDFNELLHQLIYRVRKIHEFNPNYHTYNNIQELLTAVHLIK